MFGIVLIILFVVLFLCTLSALEHLPIGSTAHRWVMAACVSALSILGLIRFVKCDGFTPQETDSADQWISFLLLPYAALAVAVVLILFCLLVHRCFHQWAKRRPDENQTRKTYLAKKKKRRDSARTFKDKK